MSTVRYVQWIKHLLCLALFVGLSMPPAWAADNDGTGTDLVETMFWICLGDHKATITASAAQCCDGGFCYTCVSDFSECWISEDPQHTRRQETLDLREQRPSISPMQDRPTQSQLQGICTSVKGRFSSLEGFGYACHKPDCDARGNDCAITCHADRRCTAITPDRITHAVSLRGILQNGDNVDRSDTGTPDTGSDTDSSGSKPPDGGGGPILY